MIYPECFVCPHSPTYNSQHTSSAYSVSPYWVDDLEMNRTKKDKTGSTGGRKWTYQEKRALLPHEYPQAPWHRTGIPWTCNHRPERLLRPLPGSVRPCRLRCWDRSTVSPLALVRRCKESCKRKIERERKNSKLTIDVTCHTMANAPCSTFQKHYSLRVCVYLHLSANLIIGGPFSRRVDCICSGARRRTRRAVDHFSIDILMPSFLSRKRALRTTVGLRKRW